GQLSSYFKGPDGNYYILKLVEKRGGEKKELFEIYDDLRAQLTIIKKASVMQELITGLSGKAKVDIYKGEIQ
ncbi:hypothetical protein ACFL38_01930, partial [Candidatus Omnitrophota bacterium]